MTPASMARFVKALYAEARITGASSHSGRRTLITHRGDRGAHKHPHDGDVRREQPEAAGAHPAGRDVVSRACLTRDEEEVELPPSRS